MPLTSLPRVVVTMALVGAFAVEAHGQLRTSRCEHDGICELRDDPQQRRSRQQLQRQAGRGIAPVLLIVNHGRDGVRSEHDRCHPTTG